ncbi:hypothetical protein B0T26DRAFT_676726 [Lasiosphaeria miniovina]|uniref:Uncharacterized protein n=1 Tax=Lasiosphaeria miniovina TaxID=1954250 RepID=A0AA40AMJ5_9PEZI|nr:uncharacterized protein B0T26DRAFT_676726 [Lasiosphaeria miniovina]KAK0718574.1 hypothetical protein B0T26DRAFT_676726 [Lasiosphaeria miniovina]
MASNAKIRVDPQNNGKPLSFGFGVSNDIHLAGPGEAAEEAAEAHAGHQPNPNSSAQYRSAAPPGCNLPPPPRSTTLSAGAPPTAGVGIPSAAAMESFPPGTCTIGLRGDGFVLRDLSKGHSSVHVSWALGGAN